MEWFTASPPISWQWVVGIIGVVAFVMALPTFLQMLYGKPKVRVEIYTHEFKSKNDIRLICSVVNEPIKNRGLCLIGVKRETVNHINGYLKIMDINSGNYLVDYRSLYLQGLEGDTTPTALPPSILPHIAHIAIWREDTNKVITFLTKKESIDMPLGEYFVFVRLFLEGRGIDKSCRLTIKDEYPFMFVSND